MHIIYIPDCLLFAESSILTTTRHTSFSHVYNASLMLNETRSPFSSNAGYCLITAPRRTYTTSLRLYSYAVTNESYSRYWNVNVTDVNGHSYVFNESHPSMGKTSSVAQLLDTMSLPVTVRVSLDLYHYRYNHQDLVWIGFQGEFDHKTELGSVYIRIYVVSWSL